MMFKRLLILGLSSFFIVACSGKDAVQAVGDVMPAPPAIGGGAGGSLGGEDSREPQTPPDSVPAVESNVAYYGMHPLTVGEALSFSFVEDNPHKIFDLEFKGQDALNFFMNQFAQSSVGTCEETSWEMSWMNVSDAGEVLDTQNPQIFQTIQASEGLRYILRVSLTGTQGCSAIGLSIEFMEEL